MAISKSISDGSERRPSLLALSFIGLIKLYRIFLSPVTALFVQCRFHPSCSTYGLEAVRKYGAWKGGIMAVKRILRCNPFFPGGYDPVK